MHNQLERFRLLSLGFLAVLIVGVIFFDVIFFNRTLQPSNILHHTGKAADWQASSALLPVINPGAQASDGFADLNASAWQYEPARHWMARNFREGQSPWWNPYSASGTLGPEVLVDIKFSPHTVISAWLFDASPASFDYGLIAIYSIGVFCLLLVFRQIFVLDWMPAIAGSLVYLLNGFAIANLNTHIGQPYFYSPVLLCSVLFFAQKQTVLRWVMLVFAHAILLTINILTTMTLVLMTVHLIGMAYWLSKSPTRQSISFSACARYMLLLASAFVLSLLLVGPLWFPIISSFLVTDMVSDFESRTLQPARSIENLLSIFTPRHFWQELAYPPRYALYPEANFEKSNALISYMGVLTSCVAAFGFCRRSRIANLLPALCVILILLCYFRVFGRLDFINYLPVFRSIGNQYWGCVSAISLFVLVAISMQNIRNGDAYLFPALFVLIFQAVSFLLLLDRIGINISGIYIFYNIVAVFLFSSCVFLIILIRKKLLSIDSLFLAVFLGIALELLYYINPVRPMRYDALENPPGFIQFIRNNIGDARVLNVGQDNTLYPEYGSMFGIKQADTQNPGLFPWYEAFFDKNFGNDTFLFLALDGTMEKKRKKNALKNHVLDESALDVASIKYILVTNAAGQYSRFLQDSNYPVVYQGEGMSIFENTDYVPAVSLAAAALGQEIDATRKAGSARILSYRNTEVIVEVESAEPATLVLSDTWSPAWMARLNGEAAEVRRVNEAFRGVDLPAGKHRVVFYYDMPALRYGSYAFVFALLLVAGISGWSCWSRGECNE